MSRLQPTGSVYLDAPELRRRTPEPAPRRNLRRVLATVLGTLGLLALTVAAPLAAVLTAVEDPGTITGALDASLADPDVRADLEAELSTAIEDSLFEEDLIAEFWFFEIDIAAEALRLAPIVLDDPGFRAALDDLVVELHERLLVEPSSAPIDMTPISLAVRTVILQEIPEADLILPPENTIYEIDPGELPDFTAPVDTARRVTGYLALGVVALGLAAALHPRRHRVLAWTGRWLLLVGLAAACLAIGLPALGARMSGQAIVEVAVRSVSGRLLAPAAVAGAAGMGMVSVAAFLKSRDRARASDEGAAAALGVDEPPLPQQLSPRMELARRGLVDAERPLTNI